MVEYTVETLDSVGEELKGAYVEADGKFNLDPDKYAEIKASGLKKKNNELLGKVKQHEGELGKFSKFKSLAELLADADESEIEEFQATWQKRGEKSKGGDADKLEMERKLQEKAAKKLADENARLATEFQKAQAELKDFKLWTPLRDIAIKAGLDPSDWEVARLELSYQQRFGFDDEGRVVVLEDGQPSNVSPEKFFKEMYSDQRPKFYKASNAAGSGAQNNTSGSKGQRTMKRSDFDAASAQVKQDFLSKPGATIVD